MKIYSLLLIILLLTGCTEKILPSETVTETKGKSFNEVVDYLDSPELLEEWLKAKTKWRQNSVQFMEPYEFFNIKRGDCNDYARFVDYILNYHGHDTVVLSIFGSGQGHTICVFKIYGKYNYFSNYSLVNSELSTINEVLNNAMNDWEIYSIYPSLEGVRR